MPTGAACPKYKQAILLIPQPAQPCTRFCPRCALGWCASQDTHSYTNARNLVIVHRHEVKVKRAQSPSEPGSERPRDVGQADGAVRMKGLGRLCIVKYF